MKLKNLTALFLSTAALSSIAFADGLSATLEVPVLPFGINGSLNYTLESPTGLVSGGSLVGNYNGSAFGLGLRAGSKYAQELASDGQLKVDGYIGAAGNVFILPSPIGLSVDASTGLKIKYALSPNARLYTDLDLIGKYSFATSSFSPFLGGTLGVKLDTIPNSDLYLQTALGTNFSGPLGYDVRAAAYYGVSPELKLGGSVGYGNMNYAPNGIPAYTTIAADSGASIRLGLQYTQLPNTIGTPGSYLP